MRISNFTGQNRKEQISGMIINYPGRQKGGKKLIKNSAALRLELSLLLAFVFCAVVSFLTFDGQCEEIRESVLRLHVLANSDSNEDQELKLHVRDRLLSEASELFAEIQSRDDAETIAQENIEPLSEIARDEIRRRGYDYDVEVRLEDSYFETRVYGDTTLPAGNYRALRVLIGEGEGHNWWCVLFPPLCVSPASGDGSLCMDDVLTAGQLSIVEDEGYEIRFKAVEIFEDAKRMLTRK